MRFRAILILPFVFGLACDEPTPGHPGEAEATDSEVERSPLGKADAIGSCQDELGDVCGGQSPDGCWCDEQCEDYGDWLGYDVYAFFPEFLPDGDPRNDEIGDDGAVGSPDFDPQVDYQARSGSNCLHRRPES